MIRKLLAAVLLALGLFTATAPALAQEPTAEQQAEMARMEALRKSLHPQTGTVRLERANATLTLGEDYYFLNAGDAKRVLTEGWGNPPDAVSEVLGMVFPADKTFLDDTWGAVITYTGDGYVSDHDASRINYSDLLDQMRQGEDEENRQRQSAGYAAINLVGWAQQPTYDPQRHNLIWAKELKFSDADANTLNYDVRVLGRRGVLSMNIVAGMKDLAVVGTDASRLMNTAAFNPGARYADYQEGTDQKAAYGIAGLVAGGAAVAVAKKAGILGILLLILKKGGVFILAGAGAVWAWIKRQFGGKAGGDFGGGKAVASRSALDETPPPEPASEDRPDDRQL